jgi:uncharacterized protein
MANATVMTTRRSSTPLTWIAFWLLVVGGLNWLLVGLFRFDLVAAIFGVQSLGARVVYILVGIAAIYSAIAIPALRNARGV